MYNTTIEKALMIALIFLPAPCAALMAVLARRSVQQTIRALGIAGAIALLTSLTVYDLATRVGSIRSLHEGVGGFRAVLASQLFLALARWLLIAALAFALWDAVSRRQGWWAVGLAATLLAGVTAFAAFSGLPIFDLFGGLFAFALNGLNTHIRTEGQARLFFIVVEVLMALAYLPALLYAHRSDGSVPEAALAPTIPDR